MGTAVTLSGAAPLTHYGNDQCLPDETRIDFLGNGTTVSICSPKCEGKEEDCPKDVPAGTTAKPTCALKYNGTKFCGLICPFNELCPNGAICFKPPMTFVGYCGYPVQLAEPIN